MQGQIKSITALLTSCRCNGSYSSTRFYIHQSTPHILSKGLPTPKLMLPKFRGDVTAWTTFWDSFKAAVHDNTELTKINKFNYLTSFLEGVAAHSIQGLTLTTKML